MNLEKLKKDQEFLLEYYEGCKRDFEELALSFAELLGNVYKNVAIAMCLLVSNLCDVYMSDFPKLAIVQLFFVTATIFLIYGKDKPREHYEKMSVSYGYMGIAIFGVIIFNFSPIVGGKIIGGIILFGFIFMMLKMRHMEHHPLMQVFTLDKINCQTEKEYFEANMQIMDTIEANKKSYELTKIKIQLKFIGLVVLIWIVLGGYLLLGLPESNLGIFLLFVVTEVIKTHFLFKKDENFRYFTSWVNLTVILGLLVCAIVNFCELFALDKYIAISVSVCIILLTFYFIRDLSKN